MAGEGSDGAHCGGWGWKAASRLPDATLMTNSASNSSSPPTSQRTHKHMCVSYAWAGKVCRYVCRYNY